MGRAVYSITNLDTKALTDIGFMQPNSSGKYYIVQNELDNGIRHNEKAMIKT